MHNSILIPLLFCFFGCSEKPIKPTPPASQFTAGVKGVLTDGNGNPVSGVQVKLFPSDYIPNSSSPRLVSYQLDTTDPAGSYEIPNVDVGKYNLEGRKDSLGIFIDSIVVADMQGITDVPPGQLKKLGKITGTSNMPGLGDTDQVRINIYIPGTSRMANPSIGGAFTFNAIPEGRYSIYFVPLLSQYKVKILDTALLSGNVLNLDTVSIQNTAIDTGALPRVESLVADSNTIGLWNFNESTGDTAHDGSGNLNHGYLHGCSWIRGIGGKALLFDGIDDYMVVQRDSTLEPDSALTIECWVKAETQNNTFYSIRIIRQAEVLDNGYILSWKQTGEPEQIQFRPSYNNGNVVVIADPFNNTSKKGQWLYLAATFKSGDSAKLFVNGTMVASTPVSFKLQYTGHIYIGGFTWLSGENEYFRGIIDEVRISKVARSPEEIRRNYSGQ